MKFLFSILFGCCAGLSVGAQNVIKAPEPKSVRPRAFIVLLNDSRLASPEIGVDIFLKIAQSKKVTETTWRREMLEEALLMADDVKNPVRRTMIPLRGVPVDTVAGFLSYAYDLKLDRLSLKSRIIKQVLLGDKERAKQIVFQMGGDLHLKPLSCEDTLAYQITDIYNAVGAVAKVGFSQKDIAEGVRAVFLAPWFENIESPAQIGPALDLLTEMQGSQIERQILFGALSRAMNRNFDDDRSFSYAIERDRITYKIGDLVSGIDDAPKTDLRLAFRGFFVKNIRGARCSDHQVKKDDSLPIYVQEASYLFPEKPFTFEDVNNSDLKGGPNVISYWQSENAKRLNREFRNILASRPKDLKSADETSKVVWGIKVTAFVESLDSWKASNNETESDVFNQKCVLFKTLIGRLPEEALKKGVIRNYMRYLTNSSILKDSFIEWFYFVQQLARENPGIFVELASDFPNPHFRLIVESKSLGL